MTFKKSFPALVFSLILSTSAFASADQAIAAAEAAQQAAAKVGYEWRDTDKMISEARKLAKEGKTQEAIELARQAEEQGHDAVAQYQREARRYSSN